MFICNGRIPNKSMKQPFNILFFRLKAWIKEISPLLGILKVSPARLKENGKICARHFKEKDFINFRKNSLVHNACPSISKKTKYFLI